MKRIRVIYWLLVSMLATASSPTSLAEKKPNFVFILADDCSYWDIGIYGSKDAITPNIDQLARDGKKFKRCYQSAPMCSPTRHNLYTGLYPVKTGAYPNHTMAAQGTKSVVHYLRPLGYRVALAGKRHITPAEVFPFEYLTEGKNPDDYPALDRFMDDARSNETPFCLFFCSKEPHTPWDKGDPSLFPPDQIILPPFFVDTDDTRAHFSRYLAEINYLDWQVGQVLDLLDQNGLSDNTLVIFASEQGNSFPFAKWTCYDVGVRSAFIARWPDKIRPGTSSDALIEYSDVLPTLIEAAGGTPPETLDGRSLLNLLFDQTDEHKDYAYSLQTTRGINNGSEHYGIRSVVNDRYRYIVNLTPEVPFQNNITERETWWKSWERVAETDEFAKDIVNRFQYRPGRELYDVIKDPYCLQNLAEDPAYKETIELLHGKLLAWMENCHDKGQETEMEAFQHMPRYLKKAGKSP
jgi:uncharacterized sulfatase